MKKQLLILFLICVSCSVQAQFNNEAIFNRIRPNDSLSKELHFNFYNFNYVRNYEYSNQFHDGYTLYGTQIEPQLVYYANPNLAITAGAYLRKDFGNKGLYDADFLFNVKYHKRNLTLVFGSLEGNIQHGYIEPIYDFERKITTPIEYGTQLLIDRQKFKLDSWIAWQKMIYKGDPAKKKMIGGLNTETTVMERGRWKMTIPAQFLAYHQGGQIDIQKETPISTLFNGATGSRSTKPLATTSKRYLPITTSPYIKIFHLPKEEPFKVVLVCG
ncbi:hypothetical protein [Pedobacter sp. UC225_65]|uniref:hypothetical protein n=1 Tax=Pedobacter sp. UC225_65 TaxID=3350173 RepID=UPI00366C1041